MKEKGRNMIFYPYELAPYVSETIWGGRRLIDEYGIVTEKANAAEGWMLSCHESGLCSIVNGDLKGKTLREVYLEHPEICGKNAAKFDDFPILIKWKILCGEMKMKKKKKNGQGAKQNRVLVCA